MSQKSARQTSKPPARHQSRAHQFARVGLFFICGALFLAGFFFTGLQHFASMDYGMKNSRMRVQIEELEAEKRRLLLAREVSSSPLEIRRVARKTGLDDRATAHTDQKPAAPTLVRSKPAENSSLPAKSTVVKTASVAQSGARVAAVYKKPATETRETKKAVLAE